MASKNKTPYPSMYDEYFAYQKECKETYGNNAIVFMQVGKFYEAYQFNDYGYNIDELSDLLDFKCAKKTGPVDKISNVNLRFIGFPTPRVAKYLDILTNKGYTVVIYDEYDLPNDKKKGRKKTDVFTPGTYIADDNNKTNYLLVVYISEEKQLKQKKNIYAVGYSLIDVATGYNMVGDIYGNENDENYGLDELTNVLQLYCPVMTFVYYENAADKDINKVIKYTDLNKYTHEFVSRSNDIYSTKKINIENDIFKIKYQEKFLENIFKIKSPIEKLELNDKIFGRISYLILLKYIKEHHENLIQNMKYPILSSQDKHLILGNNASQQLNVIDSNNLETNKKKFESLFDVINKTATIMGKRYLRNNLINPYSQNEKHKIVNRYNMIEHLIKNEFYDHYYDLLYEICDLEKLHRKIGTGTLHPFEFHLLNNSYSTINKILKTLMQDDVLNILTSSNTIDKITEFQNDYKQKFNFDEIAKYRLSDIENSFYKIDIHSDLDEIQNEIDLSRKIINKVAKKFSDLIDVNRCGKQMLTVEYNVKDGYYLSITKNRLETLKYEFKKIKEIEIKSQNKTKFILTLDNLTIKSLEKGKSKIFIDIVSKYSDNLIEKREKISELTKQYYIDDLRHYHECYQEFMNDVEKTISELDFLVSGAICAIKYKYTKPIIKNNDNVPSYIDCKNIRHPIVERINEDTEYIPHSLVLGNKDNSNGILIYGVNGSGKTIIMKAIGLSIILAQIGYFVPAEHFEYEPYLGLYARITGNDNFFKQQSSYGLEMTELDVILSRTKYNCENLLVIGDEICRGTEWISGTSIVATAVHYLSTRKTSFIFASHLHKLVSLDCIKSLNNVKCYHLEVEQDENLDCLVWNRTLLPGPGPDSYGLTVAKYIIKDKEFIKFAENVKRELLNESVEIIPTRKSKYNKNLYMTMCEICGYKKIKITDKDLETHHIKFQKDCSEDGFINDKPHVHKNHLSNLIVLCRQCHEKIHNRTIIINGVLETTNGSIYDYEFIDTIHHIHPNSHLRPICSGKSIITTTCANTSNN
jgi:DNA mismatch repair protein MutS